MLVLAVEELHCQASDQKANAEVLSKPHLGLLLINIVSSAKNAVSLAIHGTMITIPL
jgi:hypothetical protein